MSLGSVPSSILKGASTSAKIATKTSIRITNAPRAAEGFERQKSLILVILHLPTNHSMRFDTGRKTTVQRNGMCEFKVLFGYFFFQEKVTYLPCRTSAGRRRSSIRTAGMLPASVTTTTSTATMGMTMGFMSMAEPKTVCPMIWAKPKPAK